VYTYDLIISGSLDVVRARNLLDKDFVNKNFLNKEYIDLKTAINIYNMEPDFSADDLSRITF
jgi:hypothetical protein